MKKIRKVITICFLIIFYCYFANVSQFPSKILLYSDSKLEYKLCPFLRLNGEVQTSNSGKSKSYQVNLCLGDFSLKEVEVKRAERVEVIPCGDLIGLKIATKGVVIVGFSEIEDSKRKFSFFRGNKFFEKG